jgi:hypothetical protein
MVTKLKRGDTRPLDVVLKANGRPITLDGSVVFNMAPAVPGAGSAITRKSVEILDASGGKVRVLWDDAEVNVVGVFNAEFEVTAADGTTETYPTEGYLVLKFEADLG